MKKKLPAFKTDEEAARFLDRKDLSDYINAENMVPARFEFERKIKNISMRIPVNASSRRRHVSSSSMIRH